MIVDKYCGAELATKVNIPVAVSIYIDSPEAATGRRITR